MKSFDKYFESGSKIEDFLIEYFQEIYAWKFIAGTRNGKIENINEIETLFSCKYIHPVKKINGPLLDFQNGEPPVIMPDLLFESKNKFVFWVESKSSFNSNFDTIDIEVEKIEDYYKISKNCDKPLWIVITIVDDNKCNLFSAKIYNLISEIELNKIQKIYNSLWKKDVYRIFYKTYPFKKMNKELVSI